MCKQNNQVAVLVPDFIELKYNNPEQNLRDSVCIDVCLVEEIYTLWKAGVVTECCCCGHKEDEKCNFEDKEGHIIVHKDSISTMLSMGYKRHDSGLYHNRLDMFKPKTNLLKCL